MGKPLSLLVNSAVHFLNASSPQDAYNITLFEALKLSKADCGSIFSHNNKKFFRVYSSVPKNKQGVPSENGLSYQTIKTGKTHVHTRTSLLKSHPDMYEKGLKGIIIIPLGRKEANVGVIALQCYRNKKIRKDKLHTLTILGKMAGHTIQQNQNLTDLKQSLSNKELFMSIASHELKNPLTTINMYSQFIQKSIEKHQIPNRKWANVLITEIHQLKDLIDDFLSKDKFSLYDINFSWNQVDIRKLIQETLEKYQTTHSQRIFLLKDTITDSKANILADKMKLQQVMINILNNSIKFSPSESSIIVSLSSSLKYFVVAIEDKGHGIAKKDKNKLFDKFFKVNPQAEGMGLGLYVAKNIIDKHRGKIYVRSKLHQGTIVTIYLPKL